MNFIRDFQEGQGKKPAKLRKSKVHTLFPPLADMQKAGTRLFNARIRLRKNTDDGWEKFVENAPDRAS